MENMKLPGLMAVVSSPLLCRERNPSEAKTLRLPTGLHPRFSRRGIKKVLVGGCFDILHYGHVYFLREAKKLGDYLVVAIESDKNVKKLKGDSRPIHNQDQRKEILESLSFVDEVIILKDKMTDSDYFDLVGKIHPFAIATTKGDPKAHQKHAQAEKFGAKFVEIPKIKDTSTTKIAKLLRLE